MKSDLYQIFTSDALQGNTSFILWFFKKMLKIPKNSAKKLNFRLIFGSFSITPSYVLLVTPQFLLGIKGLMEMYNCGKFHLYSICGCQAIKSEMFSW